MTKKTIITVMLLCTVISKLSAGKDFFTLNNSKLEPKTDLPIKGPIFNSEFNDKFNNKKRLFLSKAKSSSSDRVIGVGAQISILKLFGGNPTLVGFGVNGIFSSDGEKNAFFGDFNYYLSGSKSSSDYATAYSSATSPSQVDITVNSKISGMGFRLGYRRYIINDISEDGFKMYFNVVAGLLLFKATSTADGYDPNSYSTTFEPTSTATGFTIGGGAGAEYTINSNLNFFGEVNLNIPANSVNGAAVEIEIPVSLQTVFGFRYHF